MEVILLGENAFKEFYGEETVKILEKIGEHSNIQNTAFSLLHDWVEKNLLLNQHPISGTDMINNETELRMNSMHKGSTNFGMFFTFLK
jgi:hypothetical protein